MIGITIEREQIIRWTTNRGGQPVLVDLGDGLCSPEINFSDQAVGREVSWDEWFACFDEGKWAFIYQDRTEERAFSRFWKVVPRFEPQLQVA